MADKFLKIGGRSEAGNAKAIKTDENGVTKTTQDETTELRTTRTNVVGYEIKAVEQNLPGRRSVTVSHAGNGGSVYVGDGTKNGVKLNSASNHIKISADETLDVKVIAEPFELQSGRFSPDVIKYIEKLDLTIALHDKHCYWSFDYGKSWGKQGSIPDGYGDRFTCLTIGEEIDGEMELYAGSHRSDGDVHAFRSIDTGQTWEPLEIVYPGEGGYDSTEIFDVLYRNGNVYLTMDGITSRKGLWITSDKGVSWERIHSATQQLQYLCDTENSVLLTRDYNVGGDVIYRSVDGTSFELISSANGLDANTNHIDSKPLYVGNDVCFIGTRNDAMGRSRRIYKSSNINSDNPTWEEVFNDPESLNYRDNVHYVWSASELIPDNNMIMFGQASVVEGDGRGNRILYSTDGGSTWEKMFRIGEINTLEHAGSQRVIMSVKNAEEFNKSDGIYLTHDSGVIPINVVEEA